MKEVIDHIQQQFAAATSNLTSSADVEEVRVRFLGKKGPIQELMRSLRDVTPEERPHSGQMINALKEEIGRTLSSKDQEFASQELEKRLVEEKIDITLPGRRPQMGAKHIITQVLDEILDLLMDMGFSVQSGPEIEDDYYNFEALNFAPDHPARDMQDTFYLSNQQLLRTHTTNIQVRIMEQHKPPLRVVSPGKVYRNEEITARSHVFFHQVDPFYIDKNVSFSDLLATLDHFLSQLFHQKVEVRYRPSYFPFVEPGMEVDIGCLLCKGRGCPICKGTGWLEILGAGMIHPNVLRKGGLDPEVYSGFAWGMGVERIALIRHGIRDIRLYFENDVRFLNQFARV